MQQHLFCHVKLKPCLHSTSYLGSTRLCSHRQIPTTRVNTKLGWTRVSFSHAAQLFAFPGEVIVFCNPVCCFEHSCWRSRQTRHKVWWVNAQVCICKIKTNPGSTQVCVYTTLFQANPGSTRVKPTSGGGLDLTRVEAGLGVFTQQKLTWVSFNPGRTRVSLCRVNRALKVNPFPFMNLVRIQFLNKLPILLWSQKFQWWGGGGSDRG